MSDEKDLTIAKRVLLSPLQPLIFPRIEDSHALPPSPCCTPTRRSRPGSDRKLSWLPSLEDESSDSDLDMACTLPPLQAVTSLSSPANDISTLMDDEGDDDVFRLTDVYSFPDREPNTSSNKIHKRRKSPRYRRDIPVRSNFNMHSNFHNTRQDDRREASTGSSLLRTRIYADKQPIAPSEETFYRRLNLTMLKERTEFFEQETRTILSALQHHPKNVMRQVENIQSEARIKIGYQCLYSTPAPRRNRRLREENIDFDIQGLDLSPRGKQTVVVANEKRIDLRFTNLVTSLSPSYVSFYDDIKRRQVRPQERYN